LYHLGIQFTKGVKKMKKTMFAVLIALLGLGVFTGIAAASSGASARISSTGTSAVPSGAGLLHEYTEQALADELGVSLADVEAAFDAGTTLCQFALDNGIAAEDLPAFLKDVRSAAIAAALADGVITQVQADRMLLFPGRGLGHGGMGRGGFGTGLCDGTGIPVGAGMRMGGRGQQVTP
jgi:hypothetical protein